jgi:hypothetical protein
VLIVLLFILFVFHWYINVKQHSFSLKLLKINCFNVIIIVAHKTLTKFEVTVMICYSANADCFFLYIIATIMHNDNARRTTKIEFRNSEFSSISLFSIVHPNLVILLPRGMCFNFMLLRLFLFFYFREILGCHEFPKYIEIKIILLYYYLLTKVQFIFLSFSFLFTKSIRALI